MKVIVYTALFGPHNGPLYEPTVVNPKVRYIAFTDQRNLRSDVWDIQQVSSPIDPQLQARIYKITPHVWLPCDWKGSSNWFLWIDSRFILQADPIKIIKPLERMQVDIAALKHPDRNKLVDEAAEIIRLRKAPEDAVRKQFEHYLAFGGAERIPALTSSGFLIRRDTNKIRLFNALWLGEVRRWTLRDQMSLDVCALQSGLTIHYLEGNYRDNPYAIWRKHAAPKRRVRRRRARKLRFR